MPPTEGGTECPAPSPLIYMESAWNCQSGGAMHTQDCTEDSSPPI